MSSFLHVSKRVWRTIVPASIRNLPIVMRAKKFYYQLFRFDPHNAVYDADYFRKDVELSAVRSADAIADSVLSDLNPSTVVDVGCGTGALLEAFQKRGCQVFGLEYAESALEYCRKRNLDVQKFDLEKEALKHHRTFDVAISMEVAEHLPETCADRYVALLTSLSRSIVFTAAPPGQQGTDHVNEQPPEYWIDKFQSQGFEHDTMLSNRWKRAWEASGVVEFFYHRNLMVFRVAAGAAPVASDAMNESI